MKIWIQALSQNPEQDPTWRAYDEACERHAPTVARPGTEIHFASADKRAPKMVISSYVKYLHLGQIIENAIHAEESGYDAFIIGGVGDLGYQELREAIDIPVLFIGETSFLVATLMGAQFAIINSDARSLKAATANAHRYGLADRLLPGAHVGRQQAEHFAMMSTDPKRAVAEFQTAAQGPISDGASLLIPGTAPISVFLAEQGVRDVDGVPVLDLHAAVIKSAEMMVDFRKLGIPKPRKGRALDVNKADVQLARKIYLS